MASLSEMYDVGWEEMRDKLRKWREDNCRNSEQIVDVGEELISEHASKLGDDIWIIYEQVMIAALDCSRDDLALTCLQELRKQFPDSHRVKRLTGMRLEALERYDEANKHYDAILQEDPTNTAARKRKISILRAQGKSTEAIRELNEYLEQFVGDQEAWHELSELYINEHDYGKAAFCLEELMMTNPHNHLYCEQYAEVKYTQGGMENLELARKYFAQALRLNNRNMRALFGLYMSASHIAASPKVSAKVKKDNIKYAAWAAAQINRAYKVRGSRSTQTIHSSYSAALSATESRAFHMTLQSPTDQLKKTQNSFICCILTFIGYLRTTSSHSEDLFICIKLERNSLPESASLAFICNAVIPTLVAFTPSGHIYSFCIKLRL
uniref:ER membrane protein complex subunit 2 n=1 Tax=Poecilia mexicana TaxID=48701 RepID=A0A3B3Y912_9TELE